MVEVGIVGCGAVVERMYVGALNHAGPYRVRWVTDLDEVRAHRVASMFRARVEPLETIAQRSDVVIVTTPPASHRPVLERCLEYGKEVLCEKPFTTSRADAEYLVARADAGGGKIYVGHFRRLYPQVKLARELVETGVIGRVTGISASEGGRFTWQAASSYTVRDKTGGVVWDTGSHTVDMALYAAGLDLDRLGSITNVVATRDVSEPSHELRGEADLEVGGSPVALQLHVSRTRALPNLVRITGENGNLTFPVGLDSRLRLTTPRGSVVVRRDQASSDPLEYFAAQCDMVLTGSGRDIFDARRFVAQIAILAEIAGA